MTKFLITGHLSPTQREGNPGAKPGWVWSTAVFRRWWPAGTAEIGAAVPLYTQSLGGANFVPWKQDGHGFTHLLFVVLLIVLMWVTVLGRGIIKSTLVAWGNLLRFCCRAICLLGFFLLFPVETASFVTGHPASLQLAGEMPVIRLLGYGCWASLCCCSLAWLMLLCLVWRQPLRGQYQQSYSCTRCNVPWLFGCQCHPRSGLGELQSGAEAKQGGRRSQTGRREQGQNASNCSWQLVPASPKAKGWTDLENAVSRWWRMLKVAGATQDVCFLLVISISVLLMKRKHLSFSYTNRSDSWYGRAVAVSGVSFQSRYWH